MTVVTMPSGAMPAAGAGSRSTPWPEAYVPLSFAPGEACQFDWSHEIVLINGVTTTVKVAHERALAA